MKTKISYEKLNICMSFCLVFFILCCILLACYWTINPKYSSVSTGYNITEEKIDKRDYYEIYDGNNIVIEAKVSVDNIFSMGTFVSREDNNTIMKGNINIEILNEANHGIKNVTYSFSDIESFSFLSVIIDDLNLHRGDLIKFKITTDGINSVNPLKVYKYNKDNEAIVYYNGEMGEDVGYIVNGENATRSYVWYPLVILFILLVFSTLHQFDFNYKVLKK